MPKDERLWEEYWKGQDEDSWWVHPAPEVLELIASQSPAQRPDVLDLGCGLGRHAVAFAQAGYTVTAADASEEAIAYLDRWAREMSLEIETLVCDARSERLPRGSFDIVLAYNVLYHGRREDFAAAIRIVHGLLREDGLLYLTCPTRVDGKYGHGPEVAPHTFECEKSITPGDVHYFSDETDLDELLEGFVQLERRRMEGQFEIRGEQLSYSYWHVLARKG